jgi:hypothetical protein
MFNQTFDWNNIDYQFVTFVFCLVAGFVYSRALNRARALEKARLEATAAATTTTADAPLATTTADAPPTTDKKRD